VQHGFFKKKKIFPGPTGNLTRVREKVAGKKREVETIRFALQKGIRGNLPG